MAIALGVGRILAGAEATAPESLPSRAYVWQRAWTPAVTAGLRRGGSSFAALDVLVAELNLADGGGVTAVEPAWGELAATHRPIGIVVRVDPYPGASDPAAPATQTLVEACREALARARAGGVEPAELQIDFDAATRRLGAYASWLNTIRTEVRPRSLVFTALPTWLGSPDFPALARAADAYVLQVHSIIRPTTPDDAFAICDPAKALAWIRQAAKVGRPFRIALPTYGYRVFFDANRQFLGLEAEGPERQWPPGTIERTVMSDGPAIAGLVQQLRDSPPAGCESLCWFRLPSASDALCWRWPTLAAVRHGDIPRARLAAKVATSADGATDLVLTNAGDWPCPPAPFHVHWIDAALVAADGIGGWRVEADGSGGLVVRPPAGRDDALVYPGDEQPVGWLRLQPRRSLEFSFTP